LTELLVIDQNRRTTSGLMATAVAQTRMNAVSRYNSASCIKYLNSIAASARKSSPCLQTLEQMLRHNELSRLLEKVGIN